MELKSQSMYLKEAIDLDIHYEARENCHSLTTTTTPTTKKP